MSESDTTMRAALGGLNVPPPSQSGPGVTNPPLADADRGSSTLWQAVRKVASFPALMGVLLGGASLVGTRLGMLDPDTWWHIAVGQGIMNTHKWPTVDTYSFTATGTHWIAYEWLGEVAMAYAFRLRGFLGIADLRIALVFLMTVLLYYYAYVRCGNWKASCVATGFFLPIASVIFTMRPQLLGYIFLLLTLICLEHFRQGRSWVLWVLPPLFMIWANTHGTFVFGMAAIGAYFAGGLVSFELGGLSAERWSKRQRVQLLLTFLLCCLATLITPYGSQIAAYPLVMATSQPLNVANIQEWQPLAFSFPIGKYFLCLVLALFLAHIFYPVKYRLHEIAILLFAVYATCVHIRFMLIFVMAIIPVVAVFIVRWMPSYDEAQDKPALNLAMAALSFLGMAILLPTRAQATDVVAKDYPVAAVQYMSDHPHLGRMFNDYVYGGYLLWQLGSEHKVFIDARADLYEYSGVFEDYLHISTVDNDALSLLSKYGIQSCLIKRKSPLSTLLAASPDWKQAYADDVSEIFVRSHPAAHVGD